MSKLLEPYQNGHLTLKNHLVMAPMTRSRAIDNIPNALMAEYYGQRSGAGLIVTEGTAPAPEGLGYARIPGVFSHEQVEGWKPVVEAAKENGSKIFVQLMHTGRVAHEFNLPDGAKVVGVSDIAAAGQIYTDRGGMQDHSAPVALTTEQVREVITGFANAAKNAIDAGFDGIELHGANGYLLEQFLNPHINIRTDEYGGSIEKRVRAILEIVEQTAALIGSAKIGIRVSPFNFYNDMPAYDHKIVEQTYSYLAEKLNALDIAYMHISQNAAATPATYEGIRENFKGTIILCNGLTPETAEQAIEQGFADLTAFGTPYLATPDLDKRIATGAPFNTPDFETFYTPGEKGYTDYAVLD